MNHTVEAFNQYPLSVLLKDTTDITVQNIPIKVYNKPELKEKDEIAIFCNLLKQYGWNFEDYNGVTLYFYKGQVVDISAQECQYLCGGVFDIQNNKPLTNIVIACDNPRFPVLYIFNSAQMTDILKDFK